MDFAGHSLHVINNPCKSYVRIKQHYNSAFMRDS